MNLLAVVAIWIPAFLCGSFVMWVYLDIRQMETCPTPCAPGCSEPCHEVHEIEARRQHNPEYCNGTRHAMESA